MLPTSHLDTMGGRVYPRPSHSTGACPCPGAPPLAGPGKRRVSGPRLPLERCRTDGTSLRSLPVLNPLQAQEQVWDAGTRPGNGSPFPLANASVSVIVPGPGCLPLGRLPSQRLAGRCAVGVGQGLTDSGPRLSVPRDHALFLSTCAHMDNGFSYSCKPNERENGEKTYVSSDSFNHLRGGGGKEGGSGIRLLT